MISEAEWVALSEALKEVMLWSSYCETRKSQLSFLVDNVEENFMAGNVTAISHTNHVEIGYNCVDQYLDDGIVKIVFVKSNKNESIILQIICGESYTKSTETMMGEKSK